MAALVSKHALVNENDGVGVKCCARSDTNRRYIFHPSIRCLVGQLISPFLSQAPSTAIQPTLLFCPSTTFDMLHTVNESMCRIPSPHSTYPISSSPALSIKDVTFNGTIYILTASQLRINKGVFSLDSARTSITTTTTTEEVLCYYPGIYPSESDTPAPSVRPPIVFS
jgi:hypothetical protein